jgi:hypothetical protein
VKAPYVYESFVEPPLKGRTSAEGWVDNACHIDLSRIATVYENYAKGAMAGHEAEYKAKLLDGGPDANVQGDDTRLRRALSSAEFDRIFSGTYRSKQAAVDGYFRSCLQSPLARSVGNYWREYYQQKAAEQAK